ncbi:MAG: FliA/WhiG family RNA polymerase sigma factor [Eubacterium sp.]|nr:FliA/WhiG family RNA polymerase sigma factor [Eubacterium sp.]
MKEAERQKVWDRYLRTKETELRDQLILEYIQVVNLVAGRMSMYLGYTVEYDDLVGYGIFGLIDAIDKYDMAKNVKFETYASLRIRGSILDHIRKMDWVPRTLRQKQKKIDNAISKIEADTGMPAKDEEIARELGLSTDELEGWRAETELSNLISLDDYLEQGNESRLDSFGSRFTGPEAAAMQEEMKRLLTEALTGLTEKEQQVITLYYYEELTLKEISQVLDVSESRVSQLHTKALRKIKERLGDSCDLLNLF